MNGSALGGGRRGEIRHRLRNIFIARGEINHLRYLIESRDLYRRLAVRTREAADQASLRSSEASVTLSLSQIRAYEAEFDAARQSDADGRAVGGRLSLLGLVWSSPGRRRAEAARTARDVAVAAAQDAAVRAEALQRANREYDEEAAFIAGNLIRAEEALLPWSGRYPPERALAVHETAMLSAIAQTSDDDLDRALRFGDLTPSQYRELMVLSGRDDIVARIDAGDIPVPTSLPFEELQDDATPALSDEPVWADETVATFDLVFVDGETNTDELVPVSGDDVAMSDETPGRDLLGEVDEGLRPREPAVPALAS